MVFQSIATPSAELEYVSDRDSGFKRPWDLEFVCVFGHDGAGGISQRFMTPVMAATVGLNR